MTKDGQTDGQAQKTNRQTDRQTDMTKLKVALHNTANALKKGNFIMHNP